MLSSWLSMIICPVRPRGPGVRSTANRSPPPLRPKAIQPGEPTRPCTGASGAVMTASVAANRHGHGRADAARDVQLVQREQNSADRLVDTFRSVSALGSTAIVVVEESTGSRRRHGRRWSRWTYDSNIDRDRNAR